MGLVKFKECLHQAIENADVNFERFANIGDELYQVKVHLGNIGRELLGKDVKPGKTRNVEAGAVYQVQKLIYHTAGTLKGMERKTETALKILKRLEDKANSVPKPSVRKSLKDIEAGEQEKHKVENLSGKIRESAR